MRPGLNVHNTLRYRQPYSPADKSALWRFAERLQPSAMLFLDNLGWAREFKQQFPSCKVMSRSYGAEAGLFTTLSAKTYFERHIRECDNGIILQVMNEPDGYIRDNDSPNKLRQMADGCAELMDSFGRAGGSIVVPNFGTGHPDTDKFGDFLPMWEAFDKWHDTHYLGVHEYWYREGVFPGDGRMLRFMSLLGWYDLHRPGKPYPRILVTEGGCDSKLDGTPWRGWKDSKTDEQYAKEITVVNDLYSKPVNGVVVVAGWVIYVWGNTGQVGTGEDWSSYQVDNAPAFQEELLRLFDQQPETPPVVIVTGPVPGDYLLEGVDSIRIRSGAATNQQIMDVLKKGERFTVKGSAVKEGSGYHWTLVETPRGEIGWLAYDYPGVKLVPAPDLPPDTPKPGLLDKLTTEELAALVVGLKALTRALEQTVSERTTPLIPATM